MNYGILCLLPILVILLVAFFTKRTLLAMICGLASASLLLGGIEGFADSVLNNVYASLSNESLQWILIAVTLFGILLTLFEKSGAVLDFGYWAGRYIKSKRGVLFGSLLLGLIIFIDDYLNNLAVSTTMKGLTDKYKIPRVQLGYVVNTLAAPVCLLFPISSWAVYFATLMGEQGVMVNGSSMKAYICGLPFAFYGWFAVLVCVLQVLGIVPQMGLMKKAYEMEEDKINKILETESDTEDLSKAKPWNFLVPIIAMIVVSIAKDVIMGTAVAVIVAFIMYLLEKKLTCDELFKSFYDGFMSMGFIFILSILAFAVQNANVELGLAEYVISVTEPFMKGGFLPAVVFLVCAVYAYATGCFWDLAAIIIPIAIPLSNAVGVNPILTSAAVFSGAAFGSNTCLYGDGVILCAQGCEVEPLDLMRTTLPYACIAGGFSFVAYLIVGFVF